MTDKPESLRIAMSSTSTPSNSTIERTQSPQKQDVDWFNFAMGLREIVFSDFIAFKLLFNLEPLATGLPL